MLNPVALEVADAGMNDRRDPAAGDEEDAHQREVPDPLQGLGRNRFQERDRLPLGQGRRRVLLDGGGLHRTDILRRFPGDKPLRGKLLKGAADDGKPSCDRGGFKPRLKERSLIELHVVGGDLEGSHPLRLHVAEEVHEVPAVGFHRVVREQRVADPGHERLSRPVALACGKGLGEEGLDLGRSRALAIQELCPLEHERWRARRRRLSTRGQSGGNCRLLSLFGLVFCRHAPCPYSPCPLTCPWNWTLAKMRPRIYPTSSPTSPRVAGRGTSGTSV